MCHANPSASNIFRHAASLPSRGAWIETRLRGQWDVCRVVAPHRGAWIETDRPLAALRRSRVAPHTGAWIETLLRCRTARLYRVAPQVAGRRMPPTDAVCAGAPT